MKNYYFDTNIMKIYHFDNNDNMKNYYFVNDMNLNIMKLYIWPLTLEIDMVT